MALENEQLRQAAPKASAIMLAALGILAYAASMMTHEALGHIRVEAAGLGVQFDAGLLT
jgi:hypothetical protein